MRRAQLARSLRLDASDAGSRVADLLKAGVQFESSVGLRSFDDSDEGSAAGAECEIELICDRESRWRVCARLVFVHERESSLQSK